MEIIIGIVVIVTVISIEIQLRGINKNLSELVKINKDKNE